MGNWTVPLFGNRSILQSTGRPSGWLSPTPGQDCKGSNMPPALWPICHWKHKGLMSGLIHSFLNGRRLSGMASSSHYWAGPHILWLFLTPDFWNNQGPKGGWLADSFPLTALLPHQPRGLGAQEEGQDLFWVSGPELVHFCWLALDGLPWPPWTKRSLNSSMFGNKVSYIHMDSSSRWFADYSYDKRFQEASRNHSSPHPWSPGGHLDSSICQFQACRKRTLTVGWQH